LSKIIVDFINSAKTNNGLGYFEGNRTAIKYAQNISKSQKRRYLRYGIIPMAFFDFLKAVAAIEPPKHIPIKKRNLDDLLDMLWLTPVRNRTDRSEGECLRVAILKEQFPELKKSFGSAEFIWKQLENYKKMKKDRKNAAQH
jgi:hypothetical protein